MKTFLYFAAALTLVALATAHGSRKSLAVSPVQASAALTQAATEQGNRLALGRVMSSLDVQLPRAIGEANKFMLVERQNLQPIIQEQAIGDSGNVDPGSAASPFQLTGADYLLVVELDDFQNFSDNASFAEISRDIERREVRVGAVARLYDTTTGAIRESISTMVDDIATEQFFTEGDRMGDTTEAIYRIVAEQLANEIAYELTESLYPAKVLAKTGAQITFNRGEGFVEPGDTWLIFAIGEDLIDPDTGENLGHEEIIIGSAEVVRVSSRTSQALLNEDNGVERGHIIRPE